MRYFVLTGLIFGFIFIFCISGVVSASVCSKECNFVKSIETRACNSEYKLCKETCSDGLCKRNCFSDKKACLKTVREEGILCSKMCSIEGKNVTCLNGKYTPGQTFLEGCESCYCDFKGKVKCTKTPFCNFNNVSPGEDFCLDNGGFYHALCNGPYFDIVCSRDKFCLCEGLNNYTCAEGSYCVKDFVSPNRRTSTIPGWKTLRGFDLGEIGICAQVPEIESCGNGICEEIICKNCSTAETRYNCPVDCA